MTDTEQARADAEFWRRHAVKWQRRAARQLRKHGLQPDGGEWGDSEARKRLAKFMGAKR